MSPQRPSEPSRKTLRDRREVAQALRDLAWRVEQGQGYYSEVTLDAYSQPSGLPMREVPIMGGYSEVRMANTKYIAFTLRLRETSQAWLTTMLQTQWAYPIPPAQTPDKAEQPPFELEP